jgi:uncharacterized protein
MRKGLVFLFGAILWVSITHFTYAQQADSSAQQAIISKAQDFVSLLEKEDFTGAVADFDSAMSAAMPPQKLGETWKSIKAQVGKYINQTGVRTEKMAQYTVVYVTTAFEKAVLDVKVVYDTKGKIAGLSVVPSQPKVEYESPSYVNPGTFTTSDLKIGKEPWILPGVLTMPIGDKPVPAVVLVHGSGPNDRDETVGPNKPFRDLAEGLSSKGIAVLRYDKRTLVYGQQMVEKLDSLTVKEETVDDANYAVELLHRTPGIDTTKIFVLGHSLGGTLIPRIGLAGHGIAGFIIMAGMNKPLEDAILDQYTYIFSLDGKVADDEKNELDKLKLQVAAVKSTSLSSATKHTDLPLGLPAKYWLDLRGYKPADVAKTLKQPMLILQGERDYQVTQDDFNAWQTALSDHANVECRLYPGLNHLFIEGQGTITPDEYQKVGHVSEAVVDNISVWIKHQ